MCRYFITFLVCILLTGSSPASSGLSLSLFNYYDDNSLYAVKLPDTIVIDSIAVHKEQREMQVFSHGELIKIYRVRLGLNPIGCKQVSGDCKTPEGLYCITYGNLFSQFHKSLGISYPNAEDIARAKKLGKSAGGDIMIHGLPNRDATVGMDRYQNDWTMGCIALRNEEIDELFDRVSPGTPIFITP